MNLVRREQGIKRVRRVLQVWRGTTNKFRDVYSDSGEIAKKMVATRVPCSCPMCGNPRRHFRQKTYQECKADDAFAAAMEELNE